MDPTPTIHTTIAADGETAPIDAVDSMDSVLEDAPAVEDGPDTEGQTSEVEEPDSDNTTIVDSADLSEAQQSIRVTLYGKSLNEFKLLCGEACDKIYEGMKHVVLTSNIAQDLIWQGQVGTTKLTLDSFSAFVQFVDRVNRSHCKLGDVLIRSPNAAEKKKQAEARAALLAEYERVKIDGSTTGDMPPDSVAYQVSKDLDPKTSRPIASSLLGNTLENEQIGLLTLKERVPITHVVIATVDLGMAHDPSKMTSFAPDDHLTGAKMGNHTNCGYKSEEFGMAIAARFNYILGCKGCRR
ncbi:uncharacterized protein MELLADRAFT_103417 [Melampsora larici-populina 98AG31]|uniref:Uncharacterized protein n=1 Tax=Melampsora larici-populina (strain 98AG31 / pathotype 3-4-7) TaxID=747676 RepID=F4RBE4_MELLP|nr:uncharacterized protein MELLADRAFT_103417 [Melampsora larici-populina 98AG31]EGG10374.1 hypothetical protein MELLADRAFT_103417 [Melampsora larici-populina 98AG31]